MDGLTECSQRLGIDLRRVPVVSGYSTLRKDRAFLVPVGIKLFREEYLGEGCAGELQCVEDIVPAAGPRSGSKQESVSLITVPQEKRNRFGGIVRLQNFESCLQLPSLTPERTIDLVQCNPFPDLRGSDAYQIKVGTVKHQNFRLRF